MKSKFEKLALKKWPSIPEVRKLTMTMNETYELQRRAFVQGLEISKGMKFTKIKPNQLLEKGDLVFHKTTFEVGEVMEERIGEGVCRVIYPSSRSWYPQPKRNIMLIEL